MRRLAHLIGAIILVCAPPALSACATIPPAPERLAALERAFAAYQRIRMAATIVVPFLSPAAQATIAAAEARADQAFAAARLAESAAEQLEQLHAAEAAAGDIAAAAR